MTKAARLAESSSFAAAAAPRSERHRLIQAVTGEETPTSAPIEDLSHNPLNPRHELTSLDDMAASLLELGQIQALTVVTRAAFLAAHPGHEEALGERPYVVIDGNRRLAGGRLAGLEEMRIDLNNDLADRPGGTRQASLVAQIHNEELSPLEEAEALAELRTVHGSIRQVGVVLGKSHAWVHQRLSLLDLTPALQAALRAGDLTIEQARKVGKLPPEEQAAAADRAQTARATRKSARRNRSSSPAGEDGSAPAQTGGNGVSTAIPSGIDPTAHSELHVGSAASNSPDDAAATGQDAEAGGDTPQGADSASRARRAGSDGSTGHQHMSAGGERSTVDLEWDDLDSLAALIREHLDGKELLRLASLITSGV